MSGRGGRRRLRRRPCAVHETAGCRRCRGRPPTGGSPAPPPRARSPARPACRSAPARGRARRSAASRSGCPRTGQDAPATPSSARRRRRTASRPGAARRRLSAGAARRRRAAGRWGRTARARSRGGRSSHDSSRRRGCRDARPSAPASTESGRRTPPPCPAAAARWGAGPAAGCRECWSGSTCPGKTGDVRTGCEVMVRMLPCPSSPPRARSVTATRRKWLPCTWGMP